MRTTWKSRLGRRGLLFLAPFGVAMAVSVLFATAMIVPAFAVHDLDVFQLDGNATTVTPPPGDDWDRIFNGTASAVDSTFITDPVDSLTDDIFTGGSSKDDNDISSWLWTPSKPQPKNDIYHAYAAVYTATVSGTVDSILYYGADLWATQGDAVLGFWFLQDPSFGVRSGGTFTGVHVIGDILLIADVAGGSVKAYRWVGSGGSDGALDLISTGGDCVGGSPDDLFCTTTNTQTVPAPWPYFGQKSTGEFEATAFVEGGINLSRLLGNQIGCFSNFVVETRSSNSVSATLSDFVTGQFQQCNVEISVSGPTLTKYPDLFKITVDVTNTGVLPLSLVNMTVTVSAVPPVQVSLVAEATSAGCDSLAIGEHCSFVATLPVPLGATDPMTVAVQADYGIGQLIGASASSSAQVGIFSPGVEVDKQGPAVASYGDILTYTFRITNTSSSSSFPGGSLPGLVITGTNAPTDTTTVVDGYITDAPLFGDLLDTGNLNVTGTTCDVVKTTGLPAGESCVVTATHQFVMGDPVPLTNTVDVMLHPLGFPNEVRATDSHRVDVARVEVAKACPADVFVGDEIPYTIVVSNTGSITLTGVTVDDSVLGQLASNLTLGPNAQQTYTPSYTPTVAGAITNTVIVNGAPETAPTVSVTASDDCTTQAWGLQVTKDAAPSYTLTYTWDITKSVNPPVVDIFDGQSAQVTYSVTATKDAGTPGSFAVTGTIAVFNPAPISATVNSVIDVVSDGIGATINCGPAGPQQQYEVGPGGTLNCTYSTPLPDGATRTNVATATLRNGSAFSGTATVDFSQAAPTLVDDTITISDTNWAATQSANMTTTVSYPVTVDCANVRTYTDGKGGTIRTNTASILETTDSATVDLPINCYRLSVSKDAQTQQNRYYSWQIDKVVNPGAVNLFEGQSQTVNYTVTATSSYTEGGFFVGGKIVITNPAPLTATVEILDVVGGQTTATLGCQSPLDVAPNATAECDYEAMPPQGLNAVNVVTVTMAPKTYTAEAQVVFGQKYNDIGRTVNVSDTNWSAAQTISNTTTFPYSGLVNCANVSYQGLTGVKSVPNTARVLATSAVDSANVDVTCYRLGVAKSATPLYTLDYGWAIDKSVDQPVVNIADGDEVTVTYTVAVTRDDGIESGWQVQGVITVTNPHPSAAAQGVQVADVFLGSGAAVDCGGSPSVNVPAGGSATCSYSISLGSKPAGTNTNTATATLPDLTSSTGTADVTFGAPTTVLDASINVTDTNEPGVVYPFPNGSGSVSYDKTFDCANQVYVNNIASYTWLNTASIVETGQSDTQAVTVNCFQISIAVDKLVSANGVNWVKEVTVTMPSPIFWRVDVTNESQRPVSLSFSDKLDGVDIPLAQLCVNPPLPATLAQGETYSCVVGPTAAITDTHTNVVTVVGCPAPETGLAAAALDAAKCDTKSSQAKYTAVPPTAENQVNEPAVGDRRIYLPVIVR